MLRLMLYPPPSSSHPIFLQKTSKGILPANVNDTWVGLSEAGPPAMRRQQSVNNHYDCPSEVTECTFLQTWLTLGPSRDKAPANTPWEQRRRRSGNILLSCERLHRIILPFPEHVQLAASSHVSHPVTPPLLGGKPLRMESSLVYLSPSQRRAQCLAHSRHADVC